MSLAVVLITRNAMPYVTTAVELAGAAQRQHEAEVLAVDAASTDGTWELLLGQPDWTVLRQSSTGIAGARNEALAATDAEVVAFLDADDRWLPGKTERQIALLTERPDVDVVACHLRRRDLTTGELAEPQAGLTPSACLFRRSAFDRVGGFDLQYRIAADHEWFVRARTAGLGIEVMSEVLLEKGVHDANTSHDRSAYARELATVFRNLPASTAPPTDPQPAHD